MNEEELNTVAKEEAESESRPRFSRRIGNMTYLVGVHFRENEGESFEEKLNRMMRSELNLSGEVV